MARSTPSNQTPPPAIARWLCALWRMPIPARPPREMANDDADNAQPWRPSAHRCKTMGTTTGHGLCFFVPGLARAVLRSAAVGCACHGVPAVIFFFLGGGGVFTSLSGSGMQFQKGRWHDQILEGSCITNSSSRSISIIMLIIEGCIFRPYSPMPSRTVTLTTGEEEGVALVLPALGWAGSALGAADVELGRRQH